MALVLLVLVAVALNVRASIAVVREVSRPRWLALAVVWLVPLFGALLTSAVLAPRSRSYSGSSANQTQHHSYCQGA